MAPTVAPSVTVIQGTGAPVAGPVLAWRHANLPSGFGMSFNVTDLMVAASDGQTAYSCALPSGAAHMQVIVTHDRGASWTRVTDLPFAQPGGCQTIWVDALNTNIVVVCCGDVNGFFQQAISIDGSASWRLSGGALAPVVRQPATRGSRTYALIQYQQPGRTSVQLGASDDGLRTWRVLDASLNTTNDRALWVNSGDGSVLLETWPDGGAVQLWLTHDDGAHWSQIPVPRRDALDYAVQQPQAGSQAWRICAQFSNGGTGPDELACTSDLGRSWTEEPALDPGPGAYYPGSLAGLPDDGSLLVTSLAGSSDTLYRLPAGATRWQTLGTVAAASCTFVPSGNGGILWSFPSESDGAGAPGPTDAVYSAAYPS
jgi:photosystem II stability/assembly factor-like uncharacterized protein